MQVHIKGGSKRQKQLVKSMVKFCQKKLMPKMYNVEININLRNFGKDDSLGYAIPSDYADLHRPREFDVDINK